MIMIIISKTKTKVIESDYKTSRSYICNIVIIVLKKTLSKLIYTKTMLSNVRFQRQIFGAPECPGSISHVHWQSKNKNICDFNGSDLIMQRVQRKMMLLAIFRR